MTTVQVAAWAPLIPNLCPPGLSPTESSLYPGLPQATLLLPCKGGQIPLSPEAQVSPCLGPAASICLERVCKALFSKVSLPSWKPRQLRPADAVRAQFSLRLHIRMGGQWPQNQSQGSRRGLGHTQRPGWRHGLLTPCSTALKLRDYNLELTRPAPRPW